MDHEKSSPCMARLEKIRFLISCQFLNLLALNWHKCLNEHLHLPNHRKLSDIRAVCNTCTITCIGIFMASRSSASPSSDLSGEAEECAVNWLQSTTSIGIGSNRVAPERPGRRGDAGGRRAVLSAAVRRRNLAVLRRRMARVHVFRPTASMRSAAWDTPRASRIRSPSTSMFERRVSSARRPSTAPVSSSPEKS